MRMYQKRLAVLICNIDINGKNIIRTDKIRFLGVLIDSKLSWCDHINAVSSSLARCVGILSKLKHFLPKSTLRSIYSSLMLPHLSYCLVVWSGANKTNLNKLVILQKKAIRHVAGCDPYDHTSPLFSSLNLLKFTDLINVSIASFIFKCLNSNLPNKFKTFFTQNSQIHKYNTRQCTDFHAFPTYSNNAQKSLRNRLVNIWNSLPCRDKTFNSLISFKSHLKRYFMSNY